MTKAERKLGTIKEWIAKLEAGLANSTLCDTGQERLRWWKRNGRRYSSILAAFQSRSWTTEMILAHLDHAGLCLIVPSKKITFTSNMRVKDVQRKYKEFFDPWYCDDEVDWNTLADDGKWTYELEVDEEELTKAEIIKLIKKGQFE